MAHNKNDLVILEFQVEKVYNLPKEMNLGIKLKFYPIDSICSSILHGVIEAGPFSFTHNKIIFPPTWRNFVCNQLAATPLKIGLYDVADTNDTKFQTSPLLGEVSISLAEILKGEPTWSSRISVPVSEERKKEEEEESSANNFLLLDFTLKTTNVVLERDYNEWNVVEMDISGLFCPPTSLPPFGLNSLDPQNCPFYFSCLFLDTLIEGGTYTESGIQKLKNQLAAETGPVKGNVKKTDLNATSTKLKDEAEKARVIEEIEEKLKKLVLSGKLLEEHGESSASVKGAEVETPGEMSSLSESDKNLMAFRFYENNLNFISWKCQNLQVVNVTPPVGNAKPVVIPPSTLSLIKFSINNELGAFEIIDNPEALSGSNTFFQGGGGISPGFTGDGKIKIYLNRQKLIQLKKNIDEQNGEWLYIFPVPILPLNESAKGGASQTIKSNTPMDVGLYQQLLSHFSAKVWVDLSPWKQSGVTETSGRFAVQTLNKVPEGEEKEKEGEEGVEEWKGALAHPKIVDQKEFESFKAANTKMAYEENGSYLMASLRLWAPLKPADPHNLADAFSAAHEEVLLEKILAEEKRSGDALAEWRKFVMETVRTVAKEVVETESDTINFSHEETLQQKFLIEMERRGIKNSLIKNSYPIVVRIVRDLLTNKSDLMTPPFAAKSSETVQKDTIKLLLSQAFSLLTNETNVVLSHVFEELQHKKDRAQISWTPEKELREETLSNVMMQVMELETLNLREFAVQTMENALLNSRSPVEFYAVSIHLARLYLRLYADAEKAEAILLHAIDFAQESIAQVPSLVLLFLASIKFSKLQYEAANEYLSLLLVSDSDAIPSNASSSLEVKSSPILSLFFSLSLLGNDCVTESRKWLDVTNSLLLSAPKITASDSILEKIRDEKPEKKGGEITSGELSSSTPQTLDKNLFNNYMEKNFQQFYLQHQNWVAPNRQENIDTGDKNVLDLIDLFLYFGLSSTVLALLEMRLLGDTFSEENTYKSTRCSLAVSKAYLLNKNYDEASQRLSRLLTAPSLSVDEKTQILLLLGECSRRKALETREQLAERNITAGKTQEKLAGEESNHLIEAQLLEKRSHDDFAKAASFLQNKQSPLILIRASNAAMQVKAWNEAKIHALNAIQVLPNSSIAYMLYGISLLRTHQHHTAIENLTKATQLLPLNSYAWFYLSLALLTANMCEQSIRTLHYTMHLKFNDATLLFEYVIKALMLNKASLYDVVELASNIILANDGHHAGALLGKGQALVKRGSIDEGVACILEALENAGDNTWIIERGALFLRTLSSDTADGKWKTVAEKARMGAYQKLKNKQRAAEDN